MKPVRTAARAMLAGVFVASGAKALTNPDPLVPRAQPVADRIGPTLALASTPSTSGQMASLIRSS